MANPGNWTQLGLPSHNGLNSEEAASRLAEVGPNDPAAQKQRSHLVEFLVQFANPLVVILLFASVVSAIIGALVNATIVSVIVLLSVAKA
jgi:Mg2+-importing ATPase